MSHLAMKAAFVSTTPDQFEAFLDRVIDELAALDIQGDVTASLARCEATIVIPMPDRISAEDFFAGLANLRTALHAAECATPGWPTGASILDARTVTGDLIDA